MNLKASLKWIGFVAASSMLVAGCGGGDATPATAAPSTAENQPAAATPTPQAPSAGGATAGAGDTLSLDNLQTNLSALKSYRTTLTYSFSGKDENGQESSSALEFFQEVIVGTKDQHTRLTGVGGSSDEPVEFYQVGDMGYIYSPKSEEGKRCLGFSSSDAAKTNPALMFKPADLLGSLSNAKLAEKGVDANGIKTDRYTVDEKGLGFGVFTSAKVDAWIAQDGNFLVKYTGEAQGKAGFLGKQGEGAVKWEYNLTDVNQVNKIDLPAECAAQKPADDIPTPPNATDKAQFGAMITFKSPDEPAKVAEFYKDQLPGLGWAAGEEMTTPDVVSLNYEKEARKLSITITKGDAGGANVVIAELKE